MRPIIIKGRIYLPIPTIAGALMVGDRFKRNEKSAMLYVTGKDERGWVKSKKVNGEETETSTPDYPVIQFV